VALFKTIILAESRGSAGNFAIFDFGAIYLNSDNFMCGSIQ
jgi:hypothetical protein